jgi:H/ACA ribonucleoprotein complex subunit 2
VVVAGDISPAEVVMHLPVACEDVGAPYTFVASRAELGAAAKTKRSTSVVMLLPEGRKRAASKKDAGGAEAAKDEVGEEDAQEYREAFGELEKALAKEYTRQMKGVI